MLLSDYYAIDTAGLRICADQASNFAKAIAGDFNPLHDPDNRRFCIPGDCRNVDHDRAASLAIDFRQSADYPFRIAPI